MSGETDLQKILATLTVSRRADPVTMLSLDRLSLDPASADVPPTVGDGIEAVISEAEGITVVATVAEAERRGWSAEFVAAWLTIEVHSSLEAVGLTRAMAAVLGDAGIPCNVLAGFYHDHILVPLDQADEAIAQLESLAAVA